MDLLNSKVLLIGGAGFIGSHTAEALIKEKVKEIIIFDDFSRGTLKNIQSIIDNPKVKIFEDADILNLHKLRLAMENVDYVFHFAALWLLECQNYPSKAFDVNIKGTFNVIETCREMNIKKLIFSSSASVYGDMDSEKIDEQSKFNNKNFYGATKICGEALLTAYYHRYGLNYLSLRYMNVYGIRQDCKGAYVSVIIKMLNSIDMGNSPTIIGSGEETFDFINVKDCARANVLAVKSDTGNMSLNVGTGQGTKLKDLAQLILKLKDSKIKIDHKPQIDQTLVKNRVANCKLAYEKIKFKYQIDLNKGLSELIMWRKNNLE